MVSFIAAKTRISLDTEIQRNEIPLNREINLAQSKKCESKPSTSTAGKLIILY